MRQLDREKSAKWQRADAQKQLYQRLQAFSFDQPDTRLLVCQRLAEENGWLSIYAQRVIQEYKKFAFLAALTGHPVSPSNPVDQVWHLHLTYTRSYWQEFCPTVLQTPLHHEPPRGGSPEYLKQDGWYGRTLESYEWFLGEIPPADIWSAPTSQFDPDSSCDCGSCGGYSVSDDRFPEKADRAPRDVACFPKGIAVHLVGQVG